MCAPTYTPMQVIEACNTGPAAMVALGLDAPTSLLDVVRTMWAAQDWLGPRQARQLATRDRMHLTYTASATKLPGAAPQGQGLPFPAPSK